MSSFKCYPWLFLVCLVYSSYSQCDVLYVQVWIVQFIHEYQFQQYHYGPVFSDSRTRFYFASEAESRIQNKQLFGISFASEAESGFGSFLVQFPEAPQSVLRWWSWFAETASPLKRIHRWLKSKWSWNKQGMNDYIWLLHLVFRHAFPFLFNNYQCTWTDTIPVWMTMLACC